MDFTTFSLREFEGATGNKRLDLTSKLDEILKTSGFLLLSDHDVPDQWKVVSNFFEQSVEMKNKVATPPYPSYPYGWIGLNKEALAASKGVKTPPDLKESFMGGSLGTPEAIRHGLLYHLDMKVIAIGT